MEIDLRDLQRYVEACDPWHVLEPGDPRYVDLDKGTPVRGSDGWSCIDELGRTIMFAGEGISTSQLFTGFTGTGKSTELRRLAQKLQDNKQTPLHVVVIDFEEHRTDSTPLSITHTLSVLAYELDRAATRAEGGNPDEPPGYLRRFYDFIAHTDVDIKGLGFQQLGVSLMAEIRNNPTIRKKVEAVLSFRFQVFVREAQDSMAESITRLRKATGAKQIVVLADGLEKVTPLREEDRELVESSAETMFVEHASFLRLPCHTVYTFPVWLMFRTAGLSSRYHRKIQILPMVKVSEPGGEPFEPGLDKLVEVIGKRLDVTRIFGKDLGETLIPIAAASGGFPRDLLRMVRELLWSARSFPAESKLVERVIAQTAAEYARTIRSPDVDLLVEIARTHELPRGDQARISAFGRLLQRYLVFAYRNGDDWYDIHPLARRASIVRERFT